MQITENQGYVLIRDIPKTELDLDKTFDCGQAFKWEKHPEGFWYGVANNRINVLKQVEDTISTNVPIESKDWLTNYLNLDMSYTAEMSKIDMTDDVYLAKAYEAGKGIHILRQDLYEMIVTFIISQMNSMKNIRNCINKLSQNYGLPLKTKLDNGTELSEYTFPTASKIASLQPIDLRSCSVGFRDSYIWDVSVFTDNTYNFLEVLSKADYDTAMRILKNFAGVGDKVANCICLFALHHIQAFPIDTHIKQIINNHYKGRLDIKKYGNIAGIVQQYMFYYKALCKED